MHGKSYIDDTSELLVLTDTSLASGYDMSVPGKQTVTVNVEGVNLTYDINVEEATLNSLELSVPYEKVNVGEKVTIEAVTEPFAVPAENLSWTVTDGKEHASVEDGVLTALSPGTVTITVSAPNELEESITLTIVSECKAITISESSLELEIGDTEQLTTIVLPKDCTDRIEWSSSNKAVAVVEEGRVTAVGAGTVVITVQAENGKSAACTVTVNGPAASTESPGSMDDDEEITFDLDEKPAVSAAPTSVAYLGVNPGLASPGTDSGSGAEIIGSESGTVAVSAAPTTAPSGDSVDTKMTAAPTVNEVTDDETDDSEEVDLDTANKTVTLGKVSVRSIKNVKGKKLKIKFKAVPKAKKYEIWCATKKNMSDAKKKKISSTSVTITGLKKKKKYYIRIRAVGYTSGSTKYTTGAWSAKYKITVKI